MTLPTLNLDRIFPNEIEISVVGAGLSGGEASPGGARQATTTTYGGLVHVRIAAEYWYKVFEHRYLNALAARLSGGFRAIDIELPLDRTQGSAMSAIVNGAHVAGATTLNVRVASGPDLIGGEWLGINHITAGHRIYGIAEVVSTDAEVGYTDYVLTISPPLREAAADRRVITYVRPICRMTLAPGTFLPWSPGPGYMASPQIDLIEADIS